MNLAQFAYESNDVGRVRSLLDRTQLKTGESDLRGFEWDYWRRLSQQELFTFKEHRKSVQRVVHSPDGKRIASGDWDGRVLVWDAQSRKVQFDLKAHEDRVNGLAFSPDGTRLVSAGFDKRLQRFTIGSHTLVEKRGLAPGP